MTKDDFSYIKDFRLITELKNDNSGYSRWAFAERDSRPYFIKEFLSPVIPQSGIGISKEQIQRKMLICENFEVKKKRIYDKLQLCETGNIVTVQEFFQFNSRYYIVTERIDTFTHEILDIAEASEKDKLLLMRVISHSIASLHKKGIVHADLKPDNILIKRTKTGSLTAKIIDFDASFLESEPPEKGEDLQADLVYMAPETFMFVGLEKKITLTRKIDIFALGLIFHQYLSGRLPEFSAEYDYYYEAALNNAKISINRGAMGLLIKDMLLPIPEKRPTIDEVFERLSDSSLEPYGGPDAKSAGASYFKNPTDL